MTKQDAVAAVAKFGGFNAAARALRISRSMLRRRLNGVPAFVPAKNTAPAAGTATEAKRAGPGRSLSDFRSLYDKNKIVPAKIKAALANMPDWLYETEFSKLSGVSLSDLGAYRDQYADHVVQTRVDHRRVWARTVAIAQQMREMV